MAKTVLTLEDMSISITPPKGYGEKYAPSVQKVSYIDGWEITPQIANYILNTGLKSPALLKQKIELQDGFELEITVNPKNNATLCEHLELLTNQNLVNDTVQSSINRQTTRKPFTSRKAEAGSDGKPSPSSEFLYVELKVTNAPYYARDMKGLDGFWGAVVDGIYGICRPLL